MALAWRRVGVPPRGPCLAGVARHANEQGHERFPQPRSPLDYDRHGIACLVISQPPLGRRSLRYDGKP